MAKQVQLRRGTTAELSSVTGATGEVIVDTTKDTLTVHDGYTAGGTPLLKEDLGNLANNSIGLGKIAVGTHGQILYYNASSQLVALNAGTSGQVLTTAGAGANPSWAEGLPSQSGNSGKVLSTNGSTASWVNGGKLVKIHTYRNDTRFSTSSSNNYTYFTWTLTKVSSTSTLVFHVVMPGQGNTNSGLNMGIGIDGSMNYDGLATPDLDSQGNFHTILQYRTGISAGNRSITLQAIPIDGTSNQTVNLINPNNNDDVRHRQQATVFVVYEIEP